MFKDLGIGKMKVIKGHWELLLLITFGDLGIESHRKSSPVMFNWLLMTSAFILMKGYRITQL